MDISDIIKSTQEQASAAWIDYLNQLRIDDLVSALSKQDDNLAAAVTELTQAKLTIVAEIIERNRGGIKGAHGFIAEASVTSFGNAEKLIDGLKSCYEWVNDNGPTDMVRDGVNIQQKFVQGDNLWGLTKVQEHLQKYPDFIKQGGKYQIPADFYEKVKTLLDMSPEEANRLQSGNGDGFTYTQWKKVQDFFQSSGVSPNDIEPASLDYADVQVNATDHTFANERDKIQEMDQRNRDRAYEASKPTMQEAAKAAGVSAALEGGTAFCIAVYKKLKAGKKISEFTAEDWKELGVDTAKGAGTGGIRGVAIYGMTNFTATPAAIASACVTAAIGMAAQSQKLRAGEITEDDFVNSSEVLCLDVSVSAVASLIGQTVIPIPVLGAVIGNVAGMFMYGMAKDHLSEKEQTITERFLTEMQTLDQILEFKYQKFIEFLRKEFAKYKSVLELAFDPQANIAFANSITLAELVGVSDEKILREKSNIDTYFLN